MIKLDQSKLHSEEQNGNCFATALACILEVPIEFVPEFENMGDDWWPNFNKWLESIGLYAIVWYEEVSLAGYYLVMGTSPRYSNQNHQVIYKDGKIYHDPHPSRAGVLNIKEVMVLVPMDPACLISSNKDRNCKNWAICLANPQECAGWMNCADGESYGR